MEEMPPEIPKPQESCKLFGRHYQPLEGKRLFHVVDALLKRPAQVICEL